MFQYSITHGGTRALALLKTIRTRFNTHFFDRFHSYGSKPDGPGARHADPDTNSFAATDGED
jgi:hypothetical protein